MWITGQLGARETIELAILGAAFDRAYAIDGVVAGVREMVGPRWWPTEDVIVGGFRRLLSEGCLEAVRRQSGPLSEADRSGTPFRTSEAGRTRLERLLKSDLPGFHTTLGTVCIGLKVSFLEMLDREDRADQIEGLIRLHETALEHLRGALPRPRQTSVLAGRWMARECKRLGSDIAWLRALSPKRDVPRIPMATGWSAER